MTIQFSCPTCGKELKTGDEKAGLSAKCPGCNTVLTVPEPDPSQAGEAWSSEGELPDAPALGRSAARSGATQDCPMCGAAVAAGATRCPACGEALTSRIAVGGPMIYAVPWKRFAAYFLDALLLNVVTLPLALAAGMAFAAVYGPERINTPEGQAALGTFSNLVQFVSLIPAWLYYALMESSSYQATLGKMALSIKVVDASGSRIGFGQATGRFFGKILSGCLCLYGYLKILWDAKRQGLHDDLAKTYVVNK